MKIKSKSDLQSELVQVKKAQKDPAKFASLYKAYSIKIRNYFLHRVNLDVQVADDLTSQTFEKALKNINSFKWQGVSFSAWVYKIAHNTLVDYYRKQNAQKNRRELHPNVKSDYPDSEKMMIDLDDASRINNALKMLPNREQEIIRLKFYDGLTNKKIAKLVHTSETNVGTIVYRAMSKIRKVLVS